MSTADALRPVFAYGTLRPGQPNWARILEGRSERVEAGRLRGVALLDCGYYPAAVDRAGAGGTIGDIVWIRPVDWPAVLAALDHLEGYDPADPDPLFDRVVRPVDSADGPVDCWVYLAGRRLAEAVLPEVPEGDWVRYCRSLPRYRSHWQAITEAGGRAGGFVPEHGG